jgi:hypothetical protein
VSWVAIDVAYALEPQAAVAATHTLDEVAEACGLAVATSGRGLEGKGR